MFQKAMKELRGDEVIARHGCIGAVDDLYFDGDCWQVRYLLLAADASRPASRLLVSVACVAGAAPQRDRLLVNLSRAQIEGGAGAWPVDAASPRLMNARLCSGRSVVGMRVEANDGPAGRVTDLLVDDEQWSIEYLLVDARATGGGRQLLVPPDWVGPIDRAQEAVYLHRTRQDLRDSPSL